MSDRTRAPALELDEQPEGIRVHGTHVYNTGTPLLLTCRLDHAANVTIRCRLLNPIGVKATPRVTGGNLFYGASITPEVAGDYWYAFSAHDQDGTLLSTREKHFVAQRPRSGK